MRIGDFKDAVDHCIERFANCPLGKNIEPERLNIPISAYDKSLAKMIFDCKNCPIENGCWLGERGNSKWVPEEDYIPKKSNPERKTWGEILKEHGIDGITFKDGKPDFSEISKGTVEIEPFSENRDDNFTKADIELAKKRGCSPEEVRKWRKENGYTWHECEDMKTMQKVPGIIHNNISHSGGISEIKKGASD